VETLRTFSAFAALGCATLGFACSSSEDPDRQDPPPEAERWQLGPVSVVQEPDSAWTVADEGGEVVARDLGSDVALLVDPTNADQDGRYAGIYAFVAEQLRFTGTYYGSLCSTFVPDRPHVDQTEVTVTARGASLTVEMIEGSLAEMVDSSFPSDEPFRWTSTWSADAAGLRLQGSGLYYLLLPKESCRVEAMGEGGSSLGSVHIDSDSSPELSYFDQVRTIEVDSAPLGALSIATDAAVLQVEVTSYPDTSLFELDFDHSFKDHGQLDVHVDVTLPLSR
jgi:hypothetical protein